MNTVNRKEGAMLQKFFTDKNQKLEQRQQQPLNDVHLPGSKLYFSQYSSLSSTVAMTSQLKTD